MPRYSPLPSVSIDPRNEAQLVQDASQKVYQSSNQSLNDFSAGNPLAALLEGQCFAQGEFLFWANQLPQSILLEWIGPFLGAMRRLGTPAVARLLLSVPPSSSSLTIPAGTAFTTNANLTGGEQFTFVTDTAVVIPAGDSQAFATVSSQYVGSLYNCPAGSITGSSAVNISGLTATNPQPAVGGSDVETYQEVQERFFTLIRRPNPVSSGDWEYFFEDFFGAGTLTSVQPNRPSARPYNYLTDYTRPNGQVSFFVLGPNGTELTQTQLSRGQNVVNFSVPVENQGHLYPFTLSQVQYNITLSIDANGAYGSNLRATSLDFRDRLYGILTPGTVFPATVDPTVGDIDSAFYSSFDSISRYSDPHIEESVAYNTPPSLDPSAATYTQVYQFVPSDYLLNQNDLVYTTLPVPVFYPVQTSFTPYSTAKPDQTLYGNLTLQQIQFLATGEYLKGQVAYWDPSVGGDGQLHVITENLSIGYQTEVPTLIAKGKITAAKTYSTWSVGSTYQETTPGGIYDPDIVQYDYVTPITNNVAADGQFVPPGSLPVSTRPGTFVWVVSNNFTLQAATNDITGAQAAFKLGSPVSPLELSPYTSYSPGQWVYTPQVGSGPNPVADPYYNYVDITKGAVNKYAYVQTSFTYGVPDGSTVSEYFDSLVEQGILKEITALNGDGGLPVYKYRPRFPAQTYLEYRQTSSSAPEYFVAASFFTPNSTDSQSLVNEGLVFPLYINLVQREAFFTSLADSSSGLKPTTRMFRFFAGDRTFFRQGNKVISYTATTSVHPLFEFSIYLDNGVFVPTQEYLPSEFLAEQYIPYFNPDYSVFSEDTVVSADGRNLYRVMKAFTPPLTVISWTGLTSANTARAEEYEGNLLRYVNAYRCEESVLSQLGRDISAIKLGVAQITLVPKNKGRFPNSQERAVYVWENASSSTETPQLSWYTGTAYPYTPPSYKDGTLRL